MLKSSRASTDAIGLLAGLLAGPLLVIAGEWWQLILALLTGVSEPWIFRTSGGRVTLENAVAGYLGLDVGRSEVTAWLLLVDGREAVRRWSVPNTRPGAEALVERVVEPADQHALRRLRIGL